MSSGSSVPAPGRAAFSHPRPLLGVPNGSQHTPRPTSRPVPGSSQAGSWAGLRAPTFLGAVPPPPAWGTEPCRLQSCPPAAMPPETGVTPLCRPALCAVLGGEPAGACQTLRMLALSVSERAENRTPCHTRTEGKTGGEGWMPTLPMWTGDHTGRNRGLFIPPGEVAEITVSPNGATWTEHTNLQSGP